MTIGYDPKFIGHDIEIQLPDPEQFRNPLRQSVLKKQELEEGVFSEHVHFTIVMNKKTRQLIYAAYNIDQDLIKRLPGEGEKSWTKVEAIGYKNQLGNKYYKDREVGRQEFPNPYDRGHMVTRSTNMWGSTDDEADKAGEATFVYANCSLQHENLNRDEWKAIELGIVRDFEDDSNNKLSLFTGPIYGDLDRHINLDDGDSARIPSGFFKVICYRRNGVPEDESLGVLAFAVFQDEKVLRDQKGGATIKTNREYQVTIRDIQDWTGIVFDGQLAQANPLFYSDLAVVREMNISSLPERIPMCGAKIILHRNQERCKIQHLNKQHVVISSAMISQKEEETDSKWLSLHNRSNREAQIGGWRVVDGHGNKVVLPDNISISAGESSVLKGNAKGNIRLDSPFGSLMLFDDQGCIIDHVTWSEPQIRRLEEGNAFLFEQGTS